jgi:hypothetical protein
LLVAFSAALAADEEMVLLRRLRGLQKRPLILDRVHPEITAIEATDGEEAASVLEARPSAAAALAASVRSMQGALANVLVKAGLGEGAGGGAGGIDNSKGGAHALMASHRFLFSLSKEAAANLPSKLSSRLFIGSTASAIDPQMLDGLGITHVVSVLRRQLQLEHVPRERHLVLHVGATQCEGTSGVRHLLKMALPFLVEVLRGADDVRRVLIHSEDGKGAGATALACAALLADSLERHSRTPMVGLVPEALADHYRKESDADAWTSKREFH